MKWKPNKSTLIKLNSSDKKLAFKSFRNSSSSFIRRKDVRNDVFNRLGRLCYLCESKHADQLDHVKSVYQCFKDDDFNFCNSIGNLMPICSKCNQSKKP